MNPRLLSVLVVVVAFFSAPAHGRERDRDFRPLTDKEKEIFYPLVCDSPGITSNHTCYQPIGSLTVADVLSHNPPICTDIDTNPDQTCNQALVGSPAADGPTQMTFNSIAYGSFSAARVDEALILFNSNIGGEVNRGVGAMLLKRQNHHWAFAGILVESIFSECVIVPNHQPERLLCLDHPMICCGQSVRYIKEFVWPTLNWPNLDPHTIMESHIGRMDDSGERLCDAGKKGQTLLTMISDLKRSQDPGVLAEADIEYAVPTDVNQLCQKRPVYDEPPVKHGHVRFIQDGDEIKVILPKGVSSFSRY